MTSEILRYDFITKCRICLNIEPEMNLLFEPIYQTEVDNERIFISLADVLRSISNIEVMPFFSEYYPRPLSLIFL